PQNRKDSFLYLFYPHTRTYTSTLSLHDALPILRIRSFLSGNLRSGSSSCTGEALHRAGASSSGKEVHSRRRAVSGKFSLDQKRLDRKSTRLNSSHVAISYAVFCLKKKKQK